MRIDMESSQQQMSWDELADRTRFVESVGFEGFWLFDHFKVFYGNPEGPCFEAWTALAGLAAATSRVRLGTLVTGITYRHPSMLAMEAITCDHISHGRVELAVGAAWHEEEHRELGFDFPQFRTRAEMLEEGIEVMRALMTETGASFEGKHFRLENAAFWPRPVQQPHIPIWIGASGEKVMLPIVARQADVWQDGGTVDELVRKSRLLDQYAEEAGRDPRSIKRAGSLDLSAPFDDSRRRAHQLREAGFFCLICGWPSEGKDRVEEFVEQVLPQLQEL